MHDLAEGAEHGVLARRHEHDPLALVAGRHEVALGLGEIARPGEHVEAGIGRHRGPRREQADILAPQPGIVAGGRRHEVRLRQSLEDHAPDRGLVEGRIEVVHDAGAEVAERRGELRGDLRVGLQGRHKIADRVLPPVDLAVLEGGGRGAGVGHDLPLDPLEMDPLRPGHPGDRAVLPGPVVRVAVVDHAGADEPLLGVEPERAGADQLGDLLGRVDGGEALGHDDEDRRPELRQGLEHEPVGPLQADDEGPVVRRLQGVGARHQGLSEAVALRPAPDRRDAVAAPHRLAVVESQALAQPEGPAPPVLLDRVALDHLRLRRELRVEAVELVEHHERVVARDVGRGRHRIDDGEVGLRHEAQDARPAALRQGRTGRQEGRGGRGGGTAEEGSSQHRGHSWRSGSGGRGRVRRAASLARMPSAGAHSVGTQPARAVPPGPVTGPGRPLRRAGAGPRGRSCRSRRAAAPRRTRPGAGAGRRARVRARAP